MVLAAETKIVEQVVGDASAWLRRNGWKAVLSPAKGHSARTASGGVAVLTRVSGGLGQPWWRQCPVIVPARAVLGHVCGFGSAGVSAIGLYLEPGVKLGGSNTFTLRSVAKEVKRIEGWWVIGGDWNMIAEELGAEGWLQEIDGVVIRPAVPLGTCPTATSDRIIDFYVACRGIAAALVSVGVQLTALVKPHRPVSMVLAKALRPQRALVVKKARPLQQEPVFGPIGCAPPSENWESLQQAGGEDRLENKLRA